jgi:hypothetical protein
MCDALIEEMYYRPLHERIELRGCLHRHFPLNHPDLRQDFAPVVSKLIVGSSSRTRFNYWSR